jgi:hypothetical protein
MELSLAGVQMERDFGEEIDPGYPDQLHDIGGQPDQQGG